MRQSSHALVYPLVVGLGIAAAVPLGVLAIGSGGSAPSVDAVATATPRRVVVASNRNDPFDTSGPAPAASAPQPTPAPVETNGGDDRWWRAQLDRLGTMSIVHLPSSSPRPAGPSPILERAQREAAARDAAVVAAQPSVETVSAAPSVVLGTAGRLGERVPASIHRWEPLILRSAKKYDLDPALIAALMQTESGGNPQAVSPMNAIGLLQVLNGPFDPETNIDQGASMLAANIKRFGSVTLGLAAYNAGPNAVVQYGGMPPYEETYNHVTRTLASWSAFRA